MRILPLLRRLYALIGNLNLNFKALLLFMSFMMLLAQQSKATGVNHTAGSYVYASNGTVYYDAGGTGNYTDGYTGQFTIYPAVSSMKVQVAFTAFSTENGYDGLMIYNGNSTGAALISSGLAAGSNATTCPAGSWRGTGSPGTITSTAADGSLTFLFRSDGSVNSTGWQANITLTGSPCGGTYYDWGGPSASYVNGISDVQTLTPPAGQIAIATFSSFATEDNYDGMMIYNGNSTGAPLISSGLGAGTNGTTCPAGAWRGGGSPGTITSSAADGSLTFSFKSDASTVGTGWAASVACCVKPGTPTLSVSSGNGSVVYAGVTANIYTATAGSPAGSFGTMQYQWNSTSGAWTNWGIGNGGTWTPAQCGDVGNTLYVRCYYANGSCVTYSNIVSSVVKSGTVGWSGPSNTQNPTLAANSCGAWSNTWCAGSGTYTYLNNGLTTNCNYTVENIGGTSCSGTALSTAYLQAFWNNAGTWNAIGTPGTNSFSFDARAAASGQHIINVSSSISVCDNDSYGAKRHDFSGASAVLRYRQNTTVSQSTSTAAVCIGSTKALSATLGGPYANYPTITWSVIPSNYGTISSISQPAATSTATFTPAAAGQGNNVTIRATVGSCYTDVTFAINAPTPATPGSISGTAAQCPGLTSQSYSISAVSNATTYTWTVPSGWTITSGQGTTSISVTTGSAGQGGNISVTAGNSCGTSAASSLAVTVANPVPATPGAITGTASQCPALTSQTYSISAVANATTYNWTVPTGWTITSGAGTTSITVTTGSAGQNGNVSVTAGNSCGTSAASSLAVTVGSATPAQPGTISGTATQCPGLTGQVYSISAVAGATTYTWTVPTGWTITAGAGSTSITVTTGSAGQNGNISVTAGNSCGTSAARTLAVTVNPATPATPGAISGTATQCPALTSQTYSITAVANATTYTWTVPTGWTVTAGAGTNSITVTTGTTGQNGNISVTAGNSCGTSGASTLAVTVGNAAPATPGAITGTATQCPAVSAQTYSISSVANATTYTWTVPTGWTITAGAGTTSITVTTGTTGQNGNVSVTAGNSCGTSAASSLAVTVGNAAPAQPGTISGTATQCPGLTGQTYSITAVANATGYTWTVPTGWTVTAGAGTTSITVTTGGAGQNGNISVTASNACGVSAARTLAVTVSPATPATPGAISGGATQCPAATGLIYSITAVANATSYNWTVPTGWTITAGTGTNSITVTAGSTGQNGNISVTATNSCGTSAASTLAVTVGSATPATPGAITGSATQCPANTGQTYSITAVAGATTYTWTVPTGWTITAGAGTTSITVTAGSAGQNGNVSVTAGNSCGTSAASTLAVTVASATPATPGAISGTTAQCPAVTGQIYSVTAVANASTYTWTVPTGWTITAGAGTNSITVTTGTTGQNGNISVTAGNSCGTSAASTLAVIVGNAAPAQPGTISGTATQCPALTGQVYSITAVANATTYTWTVPTGWTITAGAGTTSITVTTGSAGQNGNISVTAGNACGTSAARTLAVTVNPATPATPGAISGTATQCPALTSQVYSITAVPNTTTYNWTVPSGWTITAGAGTTSITVTTGSAGQNGNISVTATNSCGTSAASTLAVTVNPATPATPGSITGTAAQCPALTGQTYSIAAVPNTTTYTWTVPSGWTITAGAGTTSLTVTTGSAGQNGNISVTATNSCGTSAASTLAVTVNAATPATPGAVSGTSSQCPALTSQVYSVSAVPNATTYNWTVPSGWTITAGAGTNSITVTTGAVGQNGVIAVTAANSCGTSNSSSLGVTVGAATPSAPGAISGTTTQCPGLTGQTYSISSVAGATSYTWTVPSGWTITAGTGTTSITVTTGSAGQNGNISVSATNSCGTSAASTLAVTVNVAAPGTPGAISGSATVCPNTSAQNYSIAAVPNASTYTWTLPSGWVITSGAGTNSINVTTGSTGQNGNISVTATNSCGTSAASTLAVTVGPGAPATPGAISGTASQCPGLTGQTYSIAAVPNTTTYTWTVPSGWSITAGAGTTSITVTTGSAGQNGNISVTATNSCGTSAASTLAVVVNTPATVSVTISASPSSIVCPGTNVTFTATPTNGGSTPSYQWFLNGGVVGTNSSTYSNASLANNDQVQCVLTSNIACPVGSPATSNTVAMSVITMVAPTANVSAQPTCSTPTGTIQVTAPTGGMYEYALDGGTYQTSTTFGSVAPGSHTVTTRLIATPACISPQSGTLTVNNVPVALAVTPVSVCQGGSGSLSVNPGSVCVDNFVVPTIPGPNIIKGGWLAGYPTAATTSGAVNTTTCSFSGPARTYQIIQFQVSTTGDYIFEMNDNTTYNGAGYITTGTFTPGSCAGGSLVRADNASGSGDEPVLGSVGTPLTLTAGVTYSLVSTTDGASDVVNKEYTWTITPPAGGNILLNEPGDVEWYTSASGGSPIGSGTTFNPVGVAGSGLPNTNTAGTYSFWAACSSSPSCRTQADFVVTSNVTIHNVTPAGESCYNSSTPVSVGLSTSTNGIDYQLWRDGVAVGSAVTSTGGAITIGNTSTAGVYTVTANSGSCNVPMNGTVTIKPLPIADAGADVTLPCASNLNLTATSNNTTLFTENFGTGTNNELSTTTSGWRLKYLYGSEPNNRTEWWISYNGASPYSFSCATSGSALTLVDHRIYESPMPCDYAWDEGTMDEIAYNTTPIDARLFTTVNLSFNYLVGGTAVGTNVYDYLQVMYSLDNGTTWVPVSAGNNAGTYSLYRGMGSTNAFFAASPTNGTANITMPSAVAGQKFLLGFRWVNDGDLTGAYVGGPMVDNISVTGSASYSWSPTAGVSGANTATATVTQGATYTVVVTAGNGCTASDQVVVTAASVPTISVTGNQDVCVGGSTTMTANISGGSGVVTNILWERSSNGGGSWSNVQSNATTTYPTNSALGVGNYLYHATVTTSLNCTNTSSDVSANVKADPLVTLDPVDVNLCSGGTATLTMTASGGAPSLQYEWQYDDATIVTNGNPSGVTFSGVTTTDLTINTTNSVAPASIPLWAKVYAAGPGCDETYTLFANVNILADPTVSNPTPAVQSGLCSGGSASPISVTANGGTGSYNYQWYSNTTNTNSGGTLISGATNSSYTPTASTGTTYYYCVIGQAGSGCGPVSTANTASVTVSTPVTASVIVDECMNFALGDKYYVLVSGSGGTPPYTYPGAFYTSTTNQGVHELNAGSSSTYTVSDASGCTVTTGSVTAPTGRPTNLPFTTTTGHITADCWINDYNRWVTFRDQVTNDAIMAINDNHSNLGLVTVDVYKDATPPTIYNSSTAGSCPNTQFTAMRRHFKMASTVAPTTGVDVMLFFTDDEYATLKADAWNNNTGYPNPEYACTELDDVYNFDQIYVTKYTGANEDGNYLNNSPSGLYRVFGDNTTPNRPLIKGQYTGSNSGFQGIYGGAQTHHYVQMTVTEFSEFWLHGSQQHSTPLPVSMIYLQADAMNNAYIRLSWATATEINNRGFEVERSTDGQNWNQIGFVDGHNNSTVQNNYSYDDMNVAAGVVYYYRLKQIDYDNAFEYTDIVSARITGETTFSVKEFVPNPTTDRTSLIVTGTKEQEINIAFYNVVGQRVLESSHVVNKGANTIQFDLARLASGTYTAVVSSANEVYTQKIVLAR